MPWAVPNIGLTLRTNFELMKMLDNIRNQKNDYEERDYSLKFDESTLFWSLNIKNMLFLIQI